MNQVTVDLKQGLYPGGVHLVDRSRVWSHLTQRLALCQECSVE